MIKVNICLLLLCIFFLVWYKFYTVVHPQPTPPGRKHAFQEHGVEGLCMLQFNNKH